MSSASQTIKLLRMIGSPFLDDSVEELIESDELFQHAFKNRIALLYLLALKQQNRLERLRGEYEKLDHRMHETLITVARVAGVLNSAEIDYVIFKTIRPFPATPNDTDVIVLGSRKTYQNAIKVMEDAGYRQLASAPLQVLFSDPRGEGNVKWDKSGGIYYVDLYQDAATDYFVYLDSAKLKQHLSRVKIEGESVTILRPEVDAAAILFHSVFPENTFSLEVVLTIWEYLARVDFFDLDVFRAFICSSHMGFPVRCCLTIAAGIHQAAFGNVPSVFDDVLQRFGGKIGELDSIYTDNLRLPYKFSTRIYWSTFFGKLLEPRAFGSLINQGVHMLHPGFFLDVMISLYNRQKKQTYQQV